MTGVLVVVLVSVAALGVDLGNAMNRKQVTQNSSDFAALAGANGLPSTATPTVQLVADYLNTNADRPATVRRSATTTTAR